MRSLRQKDQKDLLFLGLAVSEMHQTGHLWSKKQFCGQKTIGAPEETETEASPTHLSPAV
jgi:hypothetical protein